MILRPGKLSAPKRIEGIRELTIADLGELLKPRDKQPVVQRFRDSHLRIARLFAMGLRVQQVAEKSGYNYNRVSTLYNDPAFQELIAQHRKVVDESFKEQVDTFHEIATSNMLTAERMVADRLEKAEDENVEIPIKTLLSISRDAADRLGHGKKNTTVNVNVDFAARLEQRRTRLIETKAVPTPPSGAEVHHPSRIAASALPATAPPMRIARRV